VSKSIPKQMRL